MMNYALMLLLLWARLLDFAYDNSNRKCTNSPFDEEFH